MDFRLPELGEGVYEAEVLRWLVHPGDAVKPGQGLVEVLTDKATMEVPSPFTGTIEAVKAESGQQVKVGDVILTYAGAPSTAQLSRDGKTTTKGNRAQTAPKPSNGPPGSTPLTVKAAPSVRALARKLGIDLAEVSGSGPQGRVLIDDLLVPERKPSGQAPAAAVDFGTPGTRIKVQGVRRKMAEHMVQSMRAVPHFSYIDECDVSELVRMRAALKEPLAAKGIRFTYLAFFVKATALALREVPLVNATLDDQTAEIVLHESCHVGVAVAAPSGLIVPIVHDADKLSLLDIAKEVERLAREARAGKTKLEDLKGGTFTITSIGNFGGLIATPIIHHPQVAILAVGKIVKRPIYDEHGKLKPADMVYLSLTCDHRVLDGAAAAAFGNALIRHLRQPAGLLIGA